MTTAVPARSGSASWAEKTSARRDCIWERFMGVAFGLGVLVIHGG